MHGTMNDWMKCAGAWFEIFGEIEQGFSKTDRDASGHWLSFSSTDAEDVPPPPRRQDAGRRQSDDRGRGTMRELYASGDGRSGHQVEQMRIRSRIISMARRALAAWCRHWGVDWTRLPRDRGCLRILSDLPAVVVPAPLPQQPPI